MKLSRAPNLTQETSFSRSLINPQETLNLHAAPQADMLLTGSPFPKSIGRCADLYHDVRELRLLMEKEVEAIKSRETEIQEHIIGNLSKSDDTGAAGLRYRAQVKSETKPQVSDEQGGWKALWAYIADHDRFDLLQKRLGEKAVADMWDNGESIPGVAKVHVPKLSITKI